MQSLNPNSFPLPTLNVRASIAYLATQRKNMKKSAADNDDDISEISFDSDNNDIENNNDIDNDVDNDMIKSSASVASSKSSKRSSVYKRIKKKNDSNNNDNNTNTNDPSDSIHIACYKGDVKKVKSFLLSNGHAINDPIKFMPYMLISEYEKVL